MKKILILLCIVILCNIGLSAQSNKSSDLDQAKGILLRLDSIAKNAIGKNFCDFESVTLDGKAISKKDLKGKVTLVDMWFVNCSPCIAEMGGFIELYGKLKDNKEFQFFSFTRDYPEVAQKAVEKYKIPYIVCPVSSEDIYRMNFGCGFPTKIIIDKEGKIVFFRTGGAIDRDKEMKEIEDIIKQML